MQRWQVCFITLRRKEFLSLKLSLSNPLSAWFTRPLWLKVSNLAWSGSAHLLLRQSKFIGERGKCLVMTYWYVKAKGPTLTRRISQWALCTSENENHVILSFELIFLSSCSAFFFFLSPGISVRARASSNRYLVVWFNSLLNREPSNVTWGKWAG